MRFVSRFQKYSKQIKEAEKVLLNGIEIEGQKPAFAHFEHGALMDWEAKEALERLSFKGLPEAINPRTRMSVFDSERAFPNDPELRRVAEESLLHGDMLNVDYILVEEPRLSPPWPTYDTESVEDIVAAIERFKFDPDYVRRYEHENQRRPEVFEALEALGAIPTDLATIVAA